MKNQELKAKIEKKLQQVMDPELEISVWDLGLIYDIKIKDDNAFIIMTLTSMGCPLFNMIEKEIKDKVIKIRGINKVDIELVFDPPWSLERMSKAARIKFEGLFK